MQKKEKIEYQRKQKQKLIRGTHIELNVLEVDILKLRYNGHIRFKVDGQSMYYVSP